MTSAKDMLTKRRELSKELVDHLKSRYPRPDSDEQGVLLFSLVSALATVLISFYTKEDDGGQLEWAIGCCMRELYDKIDKMEELVREQHEADRAIKQ